MRIVHYLSEMVLAHGGVTRAVLDLCADAALAGHAVTLLTFNAQDVPPEWRDGAPGRPRAVVLDRPSGPSSLRRFAASALDTARGTIAGADALHLHGPWEHTNIQLAALARAASVPYVVSVHGMLDDWCMGQSALRKRLYWMVWARPFLERAAAVHCTATAELEQARKWFPRGRGVVLPLQFDRTPFEAEVGPERARKRLGLGPDDPVVLFLSRLHPKKGVEVLIDAAAELRSRGVRHRLVIAGSGDPAYVESLKQRSTDAGLNGVALFPGLVLGEDKVSLFQAATVFCLPTSQENWGFVLLESLASGTPVITTRGVDIWPELEASGGAWIVESDPAAVAGALAGALGDAAATKARGERGRCWVERELNPETIRLGYINLYRSARGGTPEKGS